MNKTLEDPEQKKFQDWRTRLNEDENKISESIAKMKIDEHKLWKACPHKWGFVINEDEDIPGYGKMKKANWNQCKVCMGLVIKF